jgi:hypothetical protein
VALGGLPVLSVANSKLMRCPDLSDIAIRLCLKLTGLYGRGRKNAAQIERFMQSVLDLDCAQEQQHRNLSIVFRCKRRILNVAVPRVTRA